MAEKIGKIEKPPVERFRGKRKLFFVHLVYFPSSGVPDDFQKLLERYWSEVKQQLDNLKKRLGKTTKIFHELLYSSGEEGLKALEKLNPKSYQLVKVECDDGAELWPIEDREITDEWLDWQRCIFSGLVSEKVKKIVFEAYEKAHKRRCEYMEKRIDEGLKEGEVGILFIREGYPIQFPSDVEVFSIYPPSLDEIHKWLDERAKEEK